VNGEFMFAEYQATLDDMSKLLALPYPQMIDQMQVLEQRLAKEHEARTNPFLNLIPTLSRAVKGFAYSDR
jgi:hypothetical protein